MYKSIYRPKWLYIFQEKEKTMIRINRIMLSFWNMFDYIMISGFGEIKACCLPKGKSTDLICLVTYSSWKILAAVILVTATIMAISLICFSLINTHLWRTLMTWELMHIYILIYIEFLEYVEKINREKPLLSTSRHI